MRAQTRPAIRDARRRPAADWWNAGERSHAVQFYSDDSVLVELLARFVGTALVTGDAAIVLATRHHRNALAQHLRRRGLDVRVARAQGRYVVKDAQQMLDKITPHGGVTHEPFDRIFERVLDGASRAAGGRGYRVAVFGELVALAWASGRYEAAIKIEELWNDLALRRPFSLCCAYPMSGFSSNGHAPSFLKICAQHSHVFPAQGGAI